MEEEEEVEKHEKKKERDNIRKKIKKQLIREKELGRILEKDDGGSRDGKGENEEERILKIREIRGDDKGEGDQESWEKADNMEIEKNP